MSQASKRLALLIAAVACMLLCVSSLVYFFNNGGIIPLACGLIFIILSGVAGAHLTVMIQQRDWELRQRLQEINNLRRQNHQRERYFDEEEEFEIRRRKKINNVKIIEED